MEYDFKLPVCGKTLKWRALKVQESLDERSAFRGQSEESIKARMLIARITHYDGEARRPSQQEWGSWDALDMEMFLDEVYEKESARRAAFQKAKISATDPQADLKAALADLQVAAEYVSKAASLALEAASIAEFQKDPLGPGQT